MHGRGRNRDSGPAEVPMVHVRHPDEIEEERALGERRPEADKFCYICDVATKVGARSVNDKVKVIKDYITDCRLLPDVKVALELHAFYEHNVRGPTNNSLPEWTPWGIYTHIRKHASQPSLFVARNIKRIEKRLAQQEDDGRYLVPAPIVHSGRPISRNDIVPNREDDLQFLKMEQIFSALICKRPFDDNLSGDRDKIAMESWGQGTGGAVATGQFKRGTSRCTSTTSALNKNDGSSGSSNKGVF
jgi:hypothetical protein